MRPRSLLTVGIFLLAVTNRAAAQRTWLPLDTTRNVSIEVGKAFFKSPSNVDFATFMVTGAARIPVTAKLAVTLALPMSRMSTSYQGVSGVSATAIGNPWIGVEAIERSGLVVEAGVRPGLASDAPDKQYAFEFGVLDDYDRFEAWIPKTTSLRAVAHIGDVGTGGSFITGILGATVLLSRTGQDAQYFANYGVRIGFREPDALATLALTGRANIGHITEGGTLDQRTVHQLTFQVEAVHGAIRPYGSIRTFLDQSLRDEVKAMVVVGASFVF